MTREIKNFYLMTPLKRWECVKLRLSDTPTEVIDEYQLQNKVTHDGHVYIKIRCGMYGFLQAGLLAQELFEYQLSAHGYHQNQLIPGLWKHDTKPITFTLVVDDFGVKYVNKADVNYLTNALKETYTVTEDWEGKIYVGIHLRWNYANKKSVLAMPGYVQDGLEQFNHDPPKLRQDSSYIRATPTWGATVQYTKTPKESPSQDEKGKKFVQQVTGKEYF